jgi:CheY-like chemotaxis protein
MSASEFSEASPQFAGLKVLIVEDEAIVSFLVEDMLRDLGFAVVWHATSVEEALTILGDRRPDAAVLDVNLAGEMVFPVATHLATSRIPFIFATGYGRKGIPDAWNETPVIQKPFDIETLARGLGAVIGTQR